MLDQSPGAPPMVGGRVLGWVSAVAAVAIAVLSVAHGSGVFAAPFAAYAVAIVAALRARSPYGRGVAAFVAILAGVACLAFLALFTMMLGYS